ncbi:MULTISPECIES: flagellar biosynthesis anti-sigma factor FlgM [unclassified Campylobacter]|uniref:flagellar biosynthesis anti-sigma factor FlgM n=1 Tax=unclassified Campylobacter TaxID=2593542 RepID=UPI00123825A8|nr:MULTISPECIES: flagellar biosynthesis anti-sigma factor FlgM [unclassified Campylobacter]KAA6227454.1 flagellar biosynthesis anti-sigma factor FlgM [Campylobacter sp. LR196d]KAA6228481.1 flagellar biosynthesis anti-sigma factor FlgM [Campylobacter sp. LR286c]KAA6230871.1 flagellar biosynthesis anti-sigma factor FlgM [Campylobacter sp. LR291e]KAA6233506.1 flagellar biosynthesis anti-sigma factor FlgM [Campylobacter sp. LR264d]
MINPVKQGFVAGSTLNTTKTDKDLKTNQTQRSENDKLARIKEQVKSGSYQLDMNATANAMADSLI